MSPHDSDGFTLIELLVVVTIIVVLLALLVPSLDKAMTAGERAVCASNQDAMHNCVLMYSLDNNRRILQTVVLGGPHRLPALARKNPSGPGQSGLSDEWNILKMAPYTSGVHPQDPNYGNRLKGIWFCPSQIPPDTEPMYSFMRHHWEGNSTPVLGFDHLFLTYAYFARVTGVGDRVTRPQDLTGDKLGSGKLLLGDTIYYGPYIGNQWMFNHGNEGPAFWNGVTVKSLSGANQTFADGSVHWKSADRFNLAAMGRQVYDPAEAETGMMDGSNGIVSYW